MKLVLEAEDGSTIGMTYRGLRHGPADVITRVDNCEDVDPATYYFRTNPVFKTASSFDWLNGIIAIGVGYRTPDGVIYSLFEAL